MLYPELFRALEEVRWNLADDIPWDAFDGALLTGERPPELSPFVPTT